MRISDLAENADGFVAIGFIDEFADGDLWVAKVPSGLVQKFILLMNSLEDESIKGTEYEPGKGSMASIHQSMRADSGSPKWYPLEETLASKLQQVVAKLKPIDEVVIGKIQTLDLSKVELPEEAISDLLHKLNKARYMKIVYDLDAHVQNGKIGINLSSAN